MAICTLAPNTGIQFLDVELGLDGVKSKSLKIVLGENGLEVIPLNRDETGEHYVDPQGGIADDLDIVSGSLEKALEQFAGQWLPLPFFRNKREGPINWARVYIPNKQRSRDVKIVLGFDTTLAENDIIGASTHEPAGLEQMASRVASLMPCRADVTGGEVSFGIPSDAVQLSKFIGQTWVSDWVRRSVAPPTKKMTAEVEDEKARKQLANFAALLLSFGSGEIAEFPTVRFIDNTPDAAHNPIDVDLILDIGNSRTFGMLVEIAQGSHHVDLSRSYPLELRDLSRPEIVHRRPFESRIEFCKPYFGHVSLSRMTKRRSAFHWPSAVRIGDEAVRISIEHSSVDGATGMSSPKRYLWSGKPETQEWRFNSGGREAEDKALDSRGYFERFSAAGDLIQETDKNPKTPAVTASFSRSSLMTFFVMELLLQTLREINSPERLEAQGQKLQSRCLRRIVMTMPTAMTRPERNILRRRVEEAISEVWHSMKMPAETRPTLQTDWDEATATQAVFVYNEVVERYFGDTEAFMHALRRSENASDPLRIVSLDIGGGTSDLIISSYRSQEQALRPEQEFREGFQCAGDDIVKAVIENHVVPALLDFLAENGVQDPRDHLVSRIGSARSGQTELRRIRRKQFSQQVLTPIAYWLLESHEGTGNFNDDAPFEASWSKIFSHSIQPLPEVLEYFCGRIDETDRSLDLTKLTFSFSGERLTHTVTKVMEPFLDCLAEATYYYDCDIMLLAGRPSRFPAVRRMIARKMPVSPERILTMHDYEVGAWYPFRNKRDEIDDPKTCAAVGAMICALSEGQLNDFFMRTSEMSMRSTARFIGQMNQGRIRDDQVLFRNVDMEADRQKVDDATFTVHPPVTLGFRQLDLDRWPATMLYSITYASPDLDKPRHGDVLLTLTKRDPEEDVSEMLFDMESATTSDGEDLPVKRLYSMTLQTMLASDVHWADSGSFDLGGIKG